MAHRSPTLIDLMVLLPALHPSQLTHDGIVILKQLRLVCKDLLLAASNAVQACEVHIRTGEDSPTSQQLQRLLPLGSRLQSLEVIVTVRSGA